MSSQAALQQVQCHATALPGGWDNEGLRLGDLPAGRELLNKHIWCGKLGFLNLSLLAGLLQTHRTKSGTNPSLPVTTTRAGGRDTWLGYTQPVPSRHATQGQSQYGLVEREIHWRNVQIACFQQSNLSFVVFFPPRTSLISANSAGSSSSA